MLQMYLMVADKETEQASLTKTINEKKEEREKIKMKEDKEIQKNSRRQEKS